MLADRTHEPERRPLSTQGLFEEEPDPAQGDRRRRAGDLLLVGEIQEILAQILLRDLGGTPTIVVSELAYRGDDVAMVVIVPNRADGLAALEKRLSAESLEEWIGTLETRATTVALPKFRSESSLTLNETLKALGMTDAFDPKRADFSGMTTAELLYVGFVVHKTFLDVNEKGSEAAAVTAMGMRAGGVPQTVPFIPVIRADRPFVYLIRDVRSGTVLFVGRMVTP